MRRSHRTIQEHKHLPRDLSHLPEYAQKYPSLTRYQLSDVKRSIYHPSEPTLRQIDRDDVLHKLPDEHCRHTTHCGPGILVLVLIVSNRLIFANKLNYVHDINAEDSET